jgi:glycosyltransferase involved in cell wall biosynthesis
VTEDGFIYNFIPNGLVEVYGSVSKYITDSSAFKRQLMDINGFEEGEISTLYLPSNLKIKMKKDYTRKNRILFAGRIGYQKLAEVAVEVGALLGREGIELHFFGSIEPGYAEGDKFLKMIEPYPTIQYHGPFNGTHTLNFDDYDMFLLTTRTEGIPNAIIETCGANIFIVTVAVGGLPETIINGENGLLVQDGDKFNPSNYVQLILQAYEDKMFCDQKRIQEANLQIIKRHSLDTYDNVIGVAMGIE